MKTRTRFSKSPRFQAILVLLLSLTLGLGTYFYLLNYQAKIEADNQLSPILVAKDEIPSGTSFAEIIANQLYEVKELPQASIPLNALAPGSNQEGSLKTRGPLVAGQILISSYFTPEARNRIGLEIPRGMLAITISVDDVARVGNFVLPGSRVVIFSTSGSSSNGSSTKVLIPEALVLGIGDQTEVGADIKNPLPSPMVTVALSPKDAERVIFAASTSQLTLALAHENDPYAVIRGEQEGTISNVTGG